MDYILNLWRKKPGNRNYVCLHGSMAASGLSCLLSCRTTSQRITSKQLPAADGGVVVVVDGGLFANSFLSKFSMLSMLY